MTEVTVGVIELKVRLSEYLCEIKRGNTIVITEHGKPVGRLVPSAQPLAERVEAMRRAGLVTWNGKKLPTGQPVVALRRRHTRAELISEDANDPVSGYQRAGEKIHRGSSVRRRDRPAPGGRANWRLSAHPGGTAGGGGQSGADELAVGGGWRKAVKAFQAEWPSLLALQVTESLVARSDSLAWQHGLRAYVAVHLAAALMWQEALGEPVTVAAFDKQLWQAAGAAGLVVWPAALE